jgi:hypothetical protein
MTTEAKPRTIVQPFGMECDPYRITDIVLQSIPGCRLRGSVDAAKTVKDMRTGEERIPKDQARHLAGLPHIPGMEIHVNPAKCTYTIVDPLFEDEDLCERIRRAMAADERPFRVDKIRGVEPQSGELDKHRMKTLCRELIWLHEAGEMKLVKGAVPKKDDVERLPGNFMLNPGSQVYNSQPMFEKDFPAWIEQLSMSGG